jgi:hypothetical protein
MSANGTNIDWQAIHKKQAEGFETLEGILKDGFERVATELTLLREQGYIPIDIHEKMLRQVNEIHASIMLQYKTFITVIVKALCLVIVGLVFWLTGIKYFAPHLLG